MAVVPAGAAGYDAWWTVRPLRVSRTRVPTRVMSSHWGERDADPSAPCRSALDRRFVARCGRGGTAVRVDRTERTRGCRGMRGLERIARGVRRFIAQWVPAADAGAVDLGCFPVSVAA